MKVGFVQSFPVFNDVNANVAALKKLVTSVEADLLVLPELANTGYTFTSKEELNAVAEPFDSSPSLDTLHDCARERSCALVVGFAEKADEGLYNSSALLLPDGSRHLYRKLHLYGAENTYFTPGNIPFEVHSYNGVKLGMMICFDWFFPESARVLALKGAQIICHPVNFVLPWGQKAALIRSLENQVFIITANRYGSVERGKYAYTFTGNSQISSPNGDVLAQTGPEEDAAVVITIDPEKASNKQLNKHNDLFKNRRPEFYRDITE